MRKSLQKQQLPNVTGEWNLSFRSVSKKISPEKYLNKPVIFMSASPHQQASGPYINFYMFDKALETCPVSFKQKVAQIEV